MQGPRNAGHSASVRRRDARNSKQKTRDKMQSAFAIVHVSENRMQNAEDTLHRSLCGVQKTQDGMH